MTHWKRLAYFSFKNISCPSTFQGIEGICVCELRKLIPNQEQHEPTMHYCCCCDGMASLILLVRSWGWSDVAMTSLPTKRCSTTRQHVQIYALWDPTKKRMLFQAVKMPVSCRWKAKPCKNLLGFILTRSHVYRASLSQWAWECISISAGELESVTEGKEVWASLHRLRPETGQAGVNGWMDTWL